MEVIDGLLATPLRVVTLEQVGAKAAALAAILGLMVLLFRRPLLGVLRFLKFLGRFARRWEGEPASPGFPGRLGFPDEMAARLDGMTDAIHAAKSDASRAMSRGVANAARLDWLATRVQSIEKHLGIVHVHPTIPEPTIDIPEEY